MARLPYGPEVSSGYIPADQLSGVGEAERHRVWLGDASEPSPEEGITMADAVALIRDFFSNPTSSHSSAIWEYRESLGLFDIREVGPAEADRGGKSSPQRLLSSQPLASGLPPIELSSKDFEPSIDLLGQPVSPVTMMAFCSHILTHSALQEEGDPRLALLAELRGDEPVANLVNPALAA